MAGVTAGTVRDGSGDARAGHARRSRHATRARRQAVLRWVTVAVVMLFFLVPIVSMALFSLRFPLSGKWTLSAWNDVVSLGALAASDPGDYGPLWDGLRNSLVLVVLTVAIMLFLLTPTMIWVRLRVRRVARVVEFICLLPLTIPAIVLVVGLAPVYRVVSDVLSTATVWLCFVYVILVLPYAYRALDAGLGAIDLATLSEAARSLGAGWIRIMFRIVLPNIRGAVVSASFISVALVLGEFTVAELLARQNLQTGIFVVSQSSGQLAVAMSLAALLFAFLLLLGLSLVVGRRRHTEKGI